MKRELMLWKKRPNAAETPSYANTKSNKYPN